jgi:hypothetical protein
MRDDKTASCVVKGLSRRAAFGIAARVPSYRARAALAGPINGMSLAQSIFSGGKLS